MKFVHCDVFSDGPYSGNSLAVFPRADALSGAQMLTITKELRHFESTFVSSQKKTSQAWPVRVFDLEEELPFAGHPLLGAAAVLHHQEHHEDQATIELSLGERIVALQSTHIAGSAYQVLMNQGQPEFIAELDEKSALEFARCFSLDSDDLMPGLPMEVVSTGLRYLVLPLRKGLDRASICVPDLTDRLEQVGAQFAYLFDVNGREGRHWTNDGLIEDVATGSAAGVIGAYAHKHRLLQADGKLELQQGQHTGRASKISVQVDGGSNGINAVLVGGQVTILGHGQFEVLP